MSTSGSVTGSATSGLTESTAGRNNAARGRGGGGRRGARGGRGRNASSNAGRTNRQTTFKGTTPAMNGHVFECYEELGEKRQYAKTLEALEGYVNKSCKFPQDLAPLFATEMKEPILVRPERLPADADEVDKAIWAEELKGFVKRSAELLANFVHIHSVVWGQCSEAMCSKIKAHPQYIERTEKHDCYWLLKQIKAVTLQFDETKDDFMSIMDARTSFLNCQQGQHQTTEDYLDQIRGWCDAIEYHGGSVSESYHLIPDTDSNGRARTIEQRQRMARDRTLATAVIRGADRTRFGTLVAELANQCSRGKDEYPQDITAAYSMLVNYHAPFNLARNRNPGTSSHSAPATVTSSEASAMTFAQRGTPVGGTDGVTHDGITCYNCQSTGHYSTQCPQPGTVTATSTTGTTLVQYAFMMAQSNTVTGGIDPSWILLDSQSTISVFNNRDMLTNVRRSPHVLRAITNGGFQDSNMIGEFPNLGDVWYNRESIANILSLAEVRKVCRVTMDTTTEPAMFVHRLDGSLMKFVEHPSGLYVFSNNNSASTTAYTMVSTVAEHKRMFSRRQLEDADRARDLYRKLGRPSEAEFQSILQLNLIRNCPVTPDDAKRALLIYGPDVAVLKGKMTRTTAAPRVPTFEAIPIPAPIAAHHRNVTLCLDIFYVQGLAYLHTISRPIGFRTVAPITDRNKATLLRETKAVLRLYHARGLTVRDIHSDHEFECLRADLRPIVMDVVPPDSHVGEVERSIRTIKDRLRSCVHGLPYKRLPKLMVHHMVADAVRNLNSFPWKLGVSDTLSPATIVTGIGTPDYVSLKLELGSYVQVFEDNDPSNTPRARSLGAITLTPTGNAAGDYHFLSLATGARISRHTWTEVPITDTAIARVEALALADDQPLIQARGLVVEWRHDHPIDDDTYDLDYAVRPAADDAFAPDDYDPIDPDELADLLVAVPPFAAPDPAPAAPFPGADGNDDDHNNDNDAAEHQQHHNNDNDAADSDHDDTDILFNDDDHNNDNDAAEHQQHHNNDEDAQDQGAQGDDDTDILFYNDEEQQEGVRAHYDEDAQDQGAQGDDAQGQGAQARPYNLRQTRTPVDRFAVTMDNPHSGKSYDPPRQLTQKGTRLNNQHTDETIKHFVMHFIMTQMSAKAGLRKHGKAAEAALMKEFFQLEALDAYEALDASSLTKEQKRLALRAINLIKEKRDGNLKGRTVADGRSQRSLYSKSETTSPTISMDALMLSILVDAYERRDVGIADIAGAYLKALMDDYVIMKFTGDTVRILCEMNPEHRKYVVIEGNTEVLYVRLVKALYGCVKSALLWYKLFSETLQKMGFVLNPYDPCIANCNINDKQCTIAWYVDDTKVSHVDPDVVTDIIRKLESHFDTMTVTRGDEHTFLGMKIRYNKDSGTATISMASYLQEAIEESGMRIERTVATPASRDIFDIDQTARPLDKDDAEVFHRIVAKLVYVATRARMDILLAVGFLCTRVSKSTSQDQKKLKRLLEYIRGTLDLEYTIGADSLGRVRSWVDAAYAVHEDMKSHTGGVMSFGRGGLLCKSTKQKLNTKSSTEAELVGASDYLPNTLWVKMFMEAQGFEIVENMFEQDNESAIKLETNGRASAGSKSRHINVRYFWIKDRTASEGIHIRHCPTLAMLGDFFTKPLQGNLFRKFRAVILGYEHTNTLTTAAFPTPLEERVGIGQSSEWKDSREIDSMKENGAKHSHKRGARGVRGPTGITWADVVKGVASAKEMNKNVSRDHSLETIQLTKGKI